MKKKIKIILHTSKILYDIENTAYLEGEVSKTGENDKTVSLMQASEDEEDSGKIMGSVGSAYKKLFLIMGKYISENTTQAENDIWERDKDITIVLNMPSNFRLANVDTINNCSHNYVVDLALADWFDVTNKNSADGYRKKAANEVQLLEVALAGREAPQRLMPEQSVMPVFFGVIPGNIEAPDEDMLTTQCTKFKTTDKELSIPVGNMFDAKVCYAYPIEWGELTSIRDANNFEYLSSFTKTMVTLSNGQEYNCYTLTTAVTKEQSIRLNFK